MPEHKIETLKGCLCTSRCWAPFLNYQILLLDHGCTFPEARGAKCSPSLMLLSSGLSSRSGCRPSFLCHHFSSLLITLLTFLYSSKLRLPEESCSLRPLSHLVTTHGHGMFTLDTKHLAKGNLIKGCVTCTSNFYRCPFLKNKYNEAYCCVFSLQTNGKLDKV